jgi:cyclophilin family peptidyl-prolyl cis-trans isomerase
MEAAAMQVARLALLGLALITLVVACLLTGCGGSQDTPAAGTESSSMSSAAKAETSKPAIVLPPAAAKPADPIVVLHTTVGDIKIRLFKEKAPQTVSNFLHNYVARGFYAETIVHHVEPGVMLIAGGYGSDLAAKETRTPIYNESRGGLSNRRGTVAMIHDASSPHSGTSQFFINLADNPDFDAQESDAGDEYGYCVFGEVIEGMDVVDRIAASQTTASGEFASVPSPPVMVSSAVQLR